MFVFPQLIYSSKCAKLFQNTVMSSFGLAQILEVSVHFFIKNIGGYICLILNLERGK